jgi:transcriptional regulator with XRE-family HTH domain
MNSNESEILKKARSILGLSTEEAGRLVGVTRRAWEHWEAGARRVPLAAYELFLAKAEGLLPSHLHKESTDGLFVVVSDDGMQTIDVLSSGNFLSYKVGSKPGTLIVSSLAYDTVNRKRYRHLVQASMAANPRLKPTLDSWKSHDVDGFDE